MSIRQSRSTLAPRICRQCGKTFMGWIGALYCQKCRAERKREGERKYQQRKEEGKSIILGVTVGHCERCGREFVYNSANQKYCPTCAPDAGKVGRWKGRRNHEAMAMLMSFMPCIRPYIKRAESRGYLSRENTYDSALFYVFLIKKIDKINKMVYNKQQFTAFKPLAHRPRPRPARL